MRGEEGSPADVAAVSTCVTVGTSKYPRDPATGVELTSQTQRRRYHTRSSDNKGGVVAIGLSIALAGLGHKTVVVTSQAKVGNLEQAAVVDENVGS